MRSDPTLRKWFLLLNKRFFASEVPVDTCVRWMDDDDDADEDRCEEKYFGFASQANDGRHQYQIVLSRLRNTSLSQKLATLAHEMIHVRLGLRDDHGEAFSNWHKLLTVRGLFEKGRVVKNLTLF